MRLVGILVALVVGVAAACGPAYDPARLRIATLARGATSVTLRDETTGVVFTLAGEPTAADEGRRGPLRHLHVELRRPGASAAQSVDVVSSAGESVDPRLLVESLTELAARRGRVASRSARFHHGHPAMLVELSPLTDAPGLEAHVLVVSDGRVAVMLTNVVPAGADAAATEAFFAGMTMPAPTMPAPD